jgi:hypothetical protein
MATDDAGKEPGGGFNPFKPDESGMHGAANETAPPPPPSRGFHRYAPLLAPIILAALFNAIVPSVMNGLVDSVMKRGIPQSRIEMEVMEVVAYALLGVAAGQFGLLATWAVLGPWPLYRQWFAALAVEIGLLAALFLGISAIADHGPMSNWKELVQFILACIAIAVAVQLPLWLARLLRGWRLVPRGTDASRLAIESRQLQIRDILIAMTLVAFTLGTLKYVCQGHGARMEMQAILSILAACVAALVWSALLLPMCVWATFGASSIGVRIVVLAGYLLTLATIVLGIVTAVSLAASGRTVRILEPMAFAAFLASHVALLVTLLSGLWLARACGYVLVSVRTARRRLAPLDGGKAAAGP